jgi:hypothetical protein
MSELSVRSQLETLDQTDRQGAIRYCALRLLYYALQRHSPIDEMRLAGDVARFIGREEDRERRHLLRLAEPAHGLAGDESLFHRLERLAGRFGLRPHALFQGR